MFDSILPMAVELGQSVIPWVGTFLIGILSKYVIGKIKHDFARNTTQRAAEEVFAAAEEVWQTYAKAIKKGREDGNLTDEEKKEAKNRAIEIAKSNLGKKGLAALGRVIGAEGVSSWLGNKVESSVNKLSIARKAVESPKQ